MPRSTLNVRVSAGKLSVHRACVEAGIVKTKSRVQQITALLAKCDTDEWNEVVEWMNKQCRAH